MDTRKSSEHASDREGDTFEDAPDSTPRPMSSSTTRSLTGRRTSGTFEHDNRSSDPPPGAFPDDNADAETGKVAPGEEVANGSPRTKSPLLTSHRTSVGVMGGMDDVNLEEDKETAHSRSPTLTSQPSLPPKLPPRNPSISMQRGLSGTLPPAQFPPPPAPPERATVPAAAPPPPSRKLTSPFSWLSRNTSSNDKKVNIPSPPAASQTMSRRSTNASTATIGSNSELMLSKIEDGDETDSHSGKANRNSLRDRFKLLRMREEAGITSIDIEGAPTSPTNGGAIAGLIGRSASIGFGVGSPSSLADDKEENHAPPPMARVSSSPGPNTPMKHPTINPNLAPGTAAGFAAGPAQEPVPVDWDLWQSVVYEGPAAVARTSPEELNNAIASGIPQAIRGVVWQVLAQSKNEELESIYRDLVARGTDKERSNTTVPSFSRHDSISHVNGSIREKDSIASSASSTHSDYSTPATTATTGTSNVAGLPSPPHDGNSTEAMAKLQATLNAEKKKKAGDDVAALQKLEKTIRRDLGARTSYSKYVMAAGLQDGLFGVCKAYALFDEAVGYAQGMNFIAMPLLFNMPEEEAFCLLVRLMNKYGLRDMFIQDMPGLHLHLYQFERLLEDFEPALYCHLHRRGVSPQLYATQWFLTLFAYRFPLQLVLRIYDLILSEGLEGAILKFGLVLMQKNAQTLLAMNDMTAVTTFLKEKLFDVYIDKAPSASSLLESGFFGSAGGIDKEVYRADLLVRDACAVKISPEMLKAYTAEWQEKQRVEKEREAELDSLKQLTASLTLKVRNLEERAEKSDRDHVNMASELVRTKVDNEALQDVNESLRGQVAELQRIVDAQPEEVESRLKGQMETIMQRNIEVHNENRALEEQLADMERVLVETKVQYAQVNSEHEALKQKWNSISLMLNSK